MVYLKHLTEAILELIGLIDAGESTDPIETWRHVEDGTVWTWLADLYRPQRGPNLLFAFVKGEDSPAIWEGAGREVVLAVAECQCVKGMHRRKNGLCLLVEVINFLILDGSYHPESLTATVSKLPWDWDSQRLM